MADESFRAADAPRIDPASSLLLTDLYELNMYEAYLAAGMTGPAVFEFFVRKLPPERNFLLAAGLDQVLAFLEGVRLSEAELAWLEASGRFGRTTLERLAAFRFTGEVHAMHEGTVLFGDEPMLAVVAPLPEAQLLESRIINLLHFQTLVASKAARMALVAPGRTLLDFGLRRAHGAEAGMLAARAAYIAGFTGTATMLAEPFFGVPIFGTMAHSFIQAHGDETEAFRNFARARPDQVVLLLDTYDTEAAARKVVALAPELAREGIRLRGVRLDSGDLGAHARQVRAILDAAGLHEVRIFASGGIDEWQLRDLVARGTPIDGYGIGTSLTTSSDCPALDCAYKLQEYAGRARRKRSEGKATWPGRKQVFRRYGADGRMVADVITLADDPQAGEPLLRPVMRDGRRLAPPPGLDRIRAHAAAELGRLPEALVALEPDRSYPVVVSPALRELARATDRTLAGGATQAQPGR
jgi:nicotinate phosphoribosyltransferase